MHLQGGKRGKVLRRIQKIIVLLLLILLLIILLTMGETPGPSRTPTNTDTVSQKRCLVKEKKMTFNNETEYGNNVLLTGYRFIDLEVRHDSFLPKLW